ncbi:MAG: thiol:disulfide interchange protein DsbA/DsbL [Cellvibrionaceae bacterium]|nr:thiol:disulfide interchange protein DsbA/DsbL [Cellvibrionaceae bacterium]
MRFLALLLSFAVSLSACAQESNESAAFEEGKHYQVIANPIKSAGDSVQVTEFFWYGCGHCFAFEPLLNTWKAKLPEGAELVKSPAMWRPVMESHARVYYTAKTLGMEDDASKQFFEEMNVKGKKMSNAQEIEAFFVGLGVKAEKFRKVYNSFSVKNQVSIADSKARSVPITGTPELLVDGRYRITSTMAGGQSEMLKVAEYLVAKALDEKGR